MSSSIAAQDAPPYTLNCTGQDNHGNIIHISHDESHGSLKNTVTIDGQIIKIIGKTKNGLGIVTENFINAYGDTVYDALVPLDYNQLNVYQIYTIEGTEGLGDHLNYQALLYGSIEDGHGYKGSYVYSEIFAPISKYVANDFQMKFSFKPFYR